MHIMIVPHLLNILRYIWTTKLIYLSTNQNASYLSLKIDGSKPRAKQASLVFGLSGRRLRPFFV